MTGKLRFALGGYTFFMKRRYAWCNVVLGMVISASSLQAEWHFLGDENDIYEAARDKTIEIYKDTIDVFRKEEEPPHISEQKRLKEAWDEVLPKLKEGAALLQERDTLPPKRLIGRDKRAVQEDMQALFDDILHDLTGTMISQERRRLDALRLEIEKNRSLIADYKESRISAPEASTFLTTRAEYDRKIVCLQKRNEVLRQRIVELKKDLKARFASIGVNLNEAQIDALLSRIDGEDIINLTVTMHTLHYITQQIAALMEQSGESLKQAKRYYAMYALLQEFVVYIQTRYIDTNRNVYLPKVDAVIAQTTEMIRQTQRLKMLEEDPMRKNVYGHNLEALTLTLKTARRYKQDLIAAQKRVAQARNMAQKNLQMAQNTYKTVVLSSQLYDLIEQSSQTFVEVSRMQVPHIIPFENRQMARTYRELTERMR